MKGACLITRREIAELRQLREEAKEVALEKKQDELCGYWLPEEGIAFLLHAARSRCAAKGMEFAITIDDLKPIPTVCPILGIRLIYGGRMRGYACRASASIDRMDNSRGYVPGNVRIISWRANKLRSDGTLKELVAIAADAVLLAESKGIGASPLLSAEIHDLARQNGSCARCSRRLGPTNQRGICTRCRETPRRKRGRYG
jgi:hypothetical protein